MKLKVISNPFEIVAGAKSFFIGLFVVMLAGVIGFFSNTIFDGILNVHSGIHYDWYVYILYPILSIVTIAFWFLLFAKIFGKQNIRAIDVIGTQFFAFIPLLPASFLGFFKVAEVVTVALQQFAANPTGSLEIDTAQMSVFIVLMILVVLLSVWSAIWIYKGFKVAANLPKHIHILVYITGIIVGMIVPRFLTSIIF